MTTNLFERIFSTNLENITKEEFVHKFLEDWTTTYEQWVKDYEDRLPLIYEQWKQDAQKRYDREVEQMMKYANEHYKREYHKNNYIKRELKRLEMLKEVHGYPKVNKPSDLRFSTPGRNTSDLLLIENLEHDLSRWYDENHHIYYFKEAIGWRVSKKWYLELVWTPETQQKVDEDNRLLAESISRFYANTNYWGD